MSYHHTFPFIFHYTCFLSYISCTYIIGNCTWRSEGHRNCEIRVGLLKVSDLYYCKHSVNFHLYVQLDLTVTLCQTKNTPRFAEHGLLITTEATAARVPLKLKMQSRRRTEDRHHDDQNNKPADVLRLLRLESDGQ